ncbi:TMV resistance protein N-like [Telopea speciosissima]|uniref:TMV resistance protein N-like n=1 Tax=Telopea speciosissima TaxID=54955 RepID=UPI001CC8294F|nr:TMV resistance protein N-like [Telopea speciosissima]
MAAPQASSGSSYEVFLSFHGEDVRTNFADHLYYALDGAGIRTFRDEDELPKGDTIGPKLISAIQESKISIPIFSMNYASSKWCLNELTQISECRRTMEQSVFPIFYKVEPRDVRDRKEIDAKVSDEEYQMCFDKYQTGFDEIYAKAFEEHQMRLNTEKEKEIVQKWKKALREVGELNGWHLKERMYEGKLVKQVAKTVRSTLNKRLSHVSDRLVGIESHIKEMLMRLDIESNDRKIVGIHGLGGIGKTTIARAVCNTILSKFEEYTFIENIRENAEKYGIHYLQNQLITGILKKGNPKIADVDTGIKVIKQRFCTKKVLIVLDDVDKDQAKFLAGDLEWFGIGSKIIITSRNKNVLIAQKTDSIYEAKEMALDDSLKVFSHYAFGRDRPLEDYMGLSEAMVKITGGLPLALQVIGSSLFKKEKSVWKGMLKKLQKVPNNDVRKSLKISYDGLEDVEQQIFLDTACFFIGMKKDIACHIWEGCDFSPQVGLDVLCAKSLVTISEDGKLGMHDLLRDLGRDIVRQESIKKPGERSRIWSQEEVLDVLIKQTGTSNCEGLTIDFRNRARRQCLMSEGFAAMIELRLLQVDHAQFSPNLTNSFSELRWLSWRGCPDQYELTNFCPQKLVVLDLSNSEITEKWMGWNYIKMAVNLKVLSLSSCYLLSSTPDVSANQQLEVLILTESENLVWIDTSIGYLRNLVTLDMGDCRSLVDLPIEICQLIYLKTLDLRRCTSLNKLPEKLDRITSLTTLCVSGCNKLESLPNLPSSLEYFDASDCVLIRSLPMLSCVKNLQNLSLRGWKKLHHISSLPSSLTSLDISRCSSIRDISGLSSTSLTSLDASECSSIQDISGLPSSLTSLNLRKCTSIRDISGLSSTSLTSLDASECSSIQDITGLPSSLTSLNLRKCTSIREISNLPSTSLTSLDASECSSIQNISGGFPSSLICLNLRRCTSIRDISGLSSTSLTSLDASECSSIQNISALPSSLISLNIRRCISITCISDLSSTSLTSLDVSECSLIRDIPGLPSSLTSLDLKECTSILRISGLPSSLTSLDARHCKSMVKLSCTSSGGGLRNLKTLILNQCSSLEEIEGVDYKLGSLEIFGIELCKSLKKVKLTGLKKLVTFRFNKNDLMSDFEGEGMDSLEILDIENCKSIRKIPYLPDSKRLWMLKIDNCPKLTEIERLEDYECLKHLSIHGPTSLKTIPDISALKNLECFTIRECHLIERLPDLSNLNKLSHLYICPGSDRLARLPDLFNLKNLKFLGIDDCKNVAEIHGIDRLETLASLRIIGCESLARLPDLSMLKNLKWLTIRGCKNLAEILGIDRMEILEKLSIFGCESLKRLPDLSNLKNLKYLTIQDCKNLAEIHGIDSRLEILQNLKISGCEFLERLPDLSNLQNLEFLEIEGCKNLAEIHGFGRLENLKKLKISGCESLARLPDFSSLKNLTHLEIRGCKNLSEIHGVDRLEFLNHLDIIGCDSLERLPDLENLKNL